MQFFSGSSFFRQRIVLSLLTSLPITISDIRSKSTSPGLRDFEASFLRLIDKFTNGTQITVDETGTNVVFRPGHIVGGRLVHNCGNSRPIGYFLEMIVCLAPFAKNESFIKLKGITNGKPDISVDFFKNVVINNLKKFGFETEDNIIGKPMSLKILRRGTSPLGNGEIRFTCPIVKKLDPLILLKEGKCNKMRGIAFTTRISPQISNRMVKTTRTVMTNFLNDIHIYTDHYSGKQSDTSPGFGISLVAKTTRNCFYGVDCVGEKGQIAEDIASECCKRVLNEIAIGGVVDSSSQWIMALFMVICSEDVSKIRIGKLNKYTIGWLRALKTFFGVTFQIQPDSKTKTVLLSCKGVGLKNISRKFN
ncbi:RNA 3'-terminal phosphate cyclase-like protein [Anaeramoeba flamelloides]|uniref:RNA 3'-terminal phosphate cyclase-like protein n=1 Tax=Anaeramoeba flamelloides TaxID=1746091 RepID=A0AAV7Z6I8_9EUKA|nr:RNA 3'-terminal phosphate cyclase-like protein [Anaeramoeba flamelloides]KAJ6248986.1 RNA 3'-terminal phosphate cyclase-like protein [Anaeramoeba flamelloides]